MAWVEVVIVVMWAILLNGVMVKENAFKDYRNNWYTRLQVWAGSACELVLCGIVGATHLYVLSHTVQCCCNYL